MSDSYERWNEDRAIQLLREAVGLVEGYRAWGATIPDADVYRARIIRAHDEQDWDLYRQALDGYVEAHRRAYRRSQGLE